MPITSNSNDFINFYNNKIATIREKMNNFLSSPNTVEAPSTCIKTTSETPIRSGVFPESFTTTDKERIFLISSSKSSTCPLDHIPTNLLKHALPLIYETSIRIINNALTSGYVPQSFKITVIKPTLKKPNHDPDNLADYRPISNFPFLSQIQKTVSKQLCSFLHRKNFPEVIHLQSPPQH